MLTATKAQAATYLLGVCLFSISFLVFLNSSVSFVITDIIKQHSGVGDAVGTLGFADELVALVACPVWGLLSDRIGVRTVCVTGYAVVGLSLFLFVQATNVYPQLLLARMFFSIGGAATTTMVTAILPAMTVSGPESYKDIPSDHARPASPSVSSEVTITPSRHRRQGLRATREVPSSQKTSPTRLAGIVGMFTGSGALVALTLFLPLPARFQNGNLGAAEALMDTYYIVGTIAILVSVACFFGLRNLKGEHGKNWRGLAVPRKTSDVSADGRKDLPYWRLLLQAFGLATEDPLIALGYLGGFVARASSVGISLFIPLFVKTWFISQGLCTIDDSGDVKSQCRDAYILAAELTGISQSAALVFAPIFGFVADRYKLYHIPLLFAAICGIIGYGSFSGLSSPQPTGSTGNPIVFVIVILLGISQIGAIVCSLGLLGRGISGLERGKMGPSHVRNVNSYLRHGVIYEEVPSPDRRPLIDPQQQEGNEDLEEHNQAPAQVDDYSLTHLKGSIAGVYSLAGGAGILLLTKFGGFLYDNNSTAAPFIMLAIFNVILLVGGVLSSLWKLWQDRKTSITT